MNNLQIGAKVRVKVGQSQGKTGVVYADLRAHRREHPWHVQIDGAGETGRIAYAEEELEVIELCPFCQILLPEDPDLWNKTNTAFFGEQAKVGNIDSCDDCATYAWVADTTQMLLDTLARRQSHVVEAK